MMRAEEILSHLRRQPFHPLRVYLSNGVFYDVGHPELMYVSRREVVIALKLGRNDIPDQLAYCDPMHITNIELLDGGKKARTSRGDEQ